MAMDDEVWTAKDIAKFLKVSLPKSYQIMEDTTFPLLRFGGVKRVLRKEFLAYLEAKGNKMDLR